MASVAEPTTIGVVRRKFPAGISVALIWLLAVTAAAIFATRIGLQNPYEGDLLDILSMPSADHLLGTDGLGRDTFARLIYGGQVSLTVASGSVGIGLMIGGSLGL